MTELSFKNQALTTFIPARDLSGITSGLIRGTSPIPDNDIAGLNAATAFYYAANNLIITLDGGLPSDWFFSGPQVRVNGFFKKTDVSIDGTEFSKYERFETDADVVLFTPGRIIIRINPSDKEEIEARFASLGINKPDFGLLLIVLSFSPNGSSEVQERAYCIKYTHIPLLSSAASSLGAMTQSVQENSYKTPPCSFETFFVPQISSSFHYNFYENEEIDYEVYQLRNYAGKDLNEIPKYIKLQWNIPNFNLDQWTLENFDPSSIRVSGSVFSFLDVVSPTITSSVPSGYFIPEGTRVVALDASLNEDGLAYVMTEGRSADSAARAFDGAPTSINTEEDILREALDPFVDFVPTPTFTTATTSDYVGYIIEKSRVEEDGNFTVVDLIPVPGRMSSQFIDWKIAYGEVYRYKIRSVFRYVDYKGISLFFDSDSLISREEGIRFIDQSYVGNVNRTYYYDGLFSQATECQTTEQERPNPPNSVKIYSKSKMKNILITWAQKNTNRDVVGFNVYRKKMGDLNFLKLNSEILSIRNNFYEDFDIDPEIDYVYAVEAVDYHGNFSKLSVQYSAKIKLFNLNDDFICESLPKFYEIEGKELFEERALKKNGPMICKSRVKINVNPLFVDTLGENNFVIRVSSLDCGQKKELKLKFKTMSIYHTSPYVPEEMEDYTFRPYFTGSLLFPGLVFSF